MEDQDDAVNGGSAVAAGIVSGGGLHRLVDWLGSAQPTLREEARRTLRLLVATTAPAPAQQAVASFAVRCPILPRSDRWSTDFLNKL